MHDFGEAEFLGTRRRAVLGYQYQQLVSHEVAYLVTHLAVATEGYIFARRFGGSSNLM